MFNIPKPTTTHKTIVKLTTQYYNDNNSGYLKKVLTRLKRKSTGYDLLIEECNNMGSKEVMERIVNLFDVDDGIYQLVTYNHSYERGIVVDWDYKLVNIVNS